MIIDYVVMGDNSTRAAQLAKYNVKATTYNRLKLLLDDEISFDGLAFEDENSFNFCSDICVECDSDAIEMSPRKGSKLFN